jgi:hypothetical protein
LDIPKLDKGVSPLVIADELPLNDWLLETSSVLLLGSRRTAGEMPGVKDAWRGSADKGDKDEALPLWTASEGVLSPDG